MVRGIWAKQKQINWQKMIQYSTKYRAKSVIKRLGFILELLELGQEILFSSSEIILNAKDYTLLDPIGTNKGKRVARWYLRVNINTEELKASVWG